VPPLLFQCPFTARIAQSWVAEEVSATDVYFTVDCPACTRKHLVNPATGRVLGATDKPGTDKPDK
jgi:hypothetical protein